MYHIVIQHAADQAPVPSNALIRQWCKKTLTAISIRSAEMTVRIVGVEEISNLNSTYRHKQGATNVLSFPFQVHEQVKLAAPILGDIVICAEVVNQEASEQHKKNEAHWAHMIVHGLLHLLGHDHETDDEALKMEAIEIEILQKLGFANPYRRVGDNIKNYE